MSEVKIGFIGLGIMGEAMCKRMLDTTQYPISIYARRETQLAPFRATRARATESIAALAGEATHIIIMVPNSDDVSDVVSQLLPALRPHHRIIDMSTISPDVSRSLATRVAKAGATMVDAPVVKSRAAAESGELGIYVGGTPQGVSEVVPILRHLGSTVLPLGPNGSGLVMKLCHNMLVAQIQNGVNEALTLGRTAGLDFDTMLASFACGGAQNFYLQAKADALKKEDFEARFPIEHMHKDLQLTADFARQLELRLPGARLVQDVYDSAMGEERARQDFCATLKTVETRCKELGATAGGAGEEK